MLLQQALDRARHRCLRQRCKVEDHEHRTTVSQRLLDSQAVSRSVLPDVSAFSRAATLVALELAYALLPFLSTAFPTWFERAPQIVVDHQTTTLAYLASASMLETDSRARIAAQDAVRSGAMNKLDSERLLPWSEATNTRYRDGAGIFPDGKSPSISRIAGRGSENTSLARRGLFARLEAYPCRMSYHRRMEGHRDATATAGALLQLRFIPFRQREPYLRRSLDKQQYAFLAEMIFDPLQASQISCIFQPQGIKFSSASM
nr:hypothetical protein CFP56_03841 [Quercus suber]